MTKILKNVFIMLFGTFAILFAGFFFSSCGVDYSKISLSSDQSSLELEVGESADVVFTIENYQKGFSNKLQFDPRSDGETAIFTCSNPTYIDQNKVKVTLTGVAGGNASLYVKTLEAGKECVVSVSVTQYSKSMEFGNRVLYVSGKTDFVPDASLFNFDSHTTYKELSYFYFEPRVDFNFNTYQLMSVDTQTNVATFSDGVGGVAEANIKQFDKVMLVEEDSNALVLSFNGEESEIDLVGKFHILAVYDYSLNNENYDKIVYSLADVYVWPSLNVSISGGYVDNSTGYVDFQPLADNKIRIVPNNLEMSQYILKVELMDSALDAPISIFGKASNDFVVDIQLFDYQEPDGVEVENAVYYWKFSRNAQTQKSTNFELSISYENALLVDDESVNVKQNYNISVEIAPSALTVNGTSEPERMILYNYYRFPEFGWNELVIDVLSGFESSPNYQGVYFTFDNNYLDLIYQGVTVASGDSKLYDDLSKPFYIRGKYGILQTNTQLVVHLKSDILQGRDEITVVLDCSIIAGAKEVKIDENYQYYDYIYLDVNAQTTKFDNVLYADQKFQYVSSRLTSGEDVVEFETDDEVYILKDTRYYLNLKVTAKKSGLGNYRIYLDNGMYIDLTFNCIKTLTAQSTSISLTNEGNEAVTKFEYSRSEDSDYDDILNIEILNPSNKDEITFGNSAYIEIKANLVGEGIKFVPDSAKYLTINKVNGNYKIMTLENGNTKIVFTLSGVVVEDFNTKNEQLSYIVNVSSYSLVDEYYLKNGANYALNNIVYYDTKGYLAEENKSVTFSTTIENVNSSNFYRYYFDEQAIESIFEDAIFISSIGSVDEGNYVENCSYIISSDQYYTDLVKEKFDKRFIYFFARNKSGTSIFTTTSVVMTKNYIKDGKNVTETKNIMLNFANGLIFSSSDLDYVALDEIGQTVASYHIQFSNIFSVGTFGSFDLDSFTYRDNFGADYTIVLKSYLSQRDWTKEYDVRISANQYKSVESISLASNVTKLNFSNAKLSYTLGVYTYPSNSTNNKIRVNFAKSSKNPYANMLSWDIVATDADLGIYTIEVSCEKFYNSVPNISEIEDELKGTLYIYPAEWGDSYTSIDDAYQPIVIDIQYRNGSKSNPYLLETPQDVLGIGTNEMMLRSYYEVATVIDMSTVSEVAPIGILSVDGQDKVVGFSGSIVGTNSQATISNIAISGNNFVKTIDGKLYGGLFAQINSGATIENVNFNGKVDITSQSGGNIGLISAINKGNLTNVGVTLSQSQIKLSSSDKFFFGGVVGTNYGNIIQDFTKYDGSIYYSYDENSETYKKDVNGTFVLDNEIYVSAQNFYGQNSKNLAFFNDKLSIVVSSSTTIFAGGVAGASNGVVKRILPADSNYKLYGYSKYSAYTQISVVSENEEISNVYVGGAVGVTTYYNGVNSIVDENINNSGVGVYGLLIGGEIDTSNINDNSTDYVGGIVGYSDTVGVSKIEIFENISRIFLRANLNVGAILGFDEYDNAYGGADVNEFGFKNVVEAIDDGRNSFYSSQIIRFKEIEKRATDEVFVSIGNANGPRAYTYYVFDVSSYLKRNKIEMSTGSNIITNDSSTKDYYGDYLIVNKIGSACTFVSSIFFTSKDVSVEVEDSKFAMKSDESSENVFFMYYFGVEGRIVGSGDAQQEIENLNFITPNSEFYPFALKNDEISISSATPNIISIDMNGNMTLKGTGLAVIKLNSILNVTKQKNVYIFVTNYFDKNVSSSLFYTSANLNGVNVTDGSNLTIYGNSNTNLYLVPTYNLDKGTTSSGDVFAISEKGILTFNNVAYALAKNSQITTDIDTDENDTDWFSQVQLTKQTLVFFKEKSSSEDNIDRYALTPVLSVVVPIDGVEYVYYYQLEASTINLNVKYRETATAIRTTYKYHSMQTNNVFGDTVTVVSTNNSELLFYQIFDENGQLIQSRLPQDLSQFDTASNREEDWLEYLNTISQNDLFDLQFERVGINVFDYVCAINKSSVRFLDRFNQNIFGEYTVHLYASELEEGVEVSFKIQLDEAEVSYVSISNFSNSNDLSVADEVIVPSQRGMLEISIDPVEAVFENFTISNSTKNYNDGATEASLSFVYEKVTSNGVEYVVDANFGRFKDGSLTFTYQEMIDLFADLNSKFASSNDSVAYIGKIYIAYYMPSTNVDNGIPVAFDVELSYGNAGANVIQTKIDLTTKLGSFAKLVFDDKVENGGVYYVARGLKYDLTLDYYGFSEDQVSIVSSNDAIASVSGENGKYTLQITPESITYLNDIGYKVEITTSATKIVDNVEITTRDVLTIYVMEYVVNYAYVPGVNEDIVKGMQDGVVSTAVGNPFDLEFSIRDFLEYDSSNSVVNNEVDRFVDDMTKNIEWKVFLENEEDGTKLEQGKIIRTDYYYIKSLSVTPLKVYKSASDLYHFTANAYYTIRNGIYSYSSISTGANQIFTRFDFDVHEQSTEDSPIPIRTYQELVDMKDDEWYILLNDIVLPGSEYAEANNLEEFKPLDAKISGLDGNNYKLIMAGTYNFVDMSSIGLFSTLNEGSILKNVNITLSNDVVFKLNTSIFNVGLLVSENNGIITNCSVNSMSGKGLSVVSSVTTSSSYVAGLVATNNGYITNSRSTLNIFSNVNLSGFVGKNTGLIASSYFLGGSLKNETNTTSEYTAGFVISNAGKIYASYVSGTPEANKMFYYEDGEEQNVISSSNNVAGFVYSNEGDVQDCYSNIQLKQSGAFASGFVFENSGNIQRAFSLSMLESRQTSNYGFARANYIGDALGLIEDCFYLQESQGSGLGFDVNVSIGTINNDDRTDITALDREGFANLDNFQNFVVAEGRNINSVWFFNTESSDLNNFNGSIFNTNRIELVASNIVATSRRELDRIESVVDETTGATSTRYVYNYSTGYPALGSMYNPILISDAENMEEYILQENNSAGYNYSYYRIIADIDYQNYIYNSRLYQTKFMGYLEGNFMSISNIYLLSSENVSCAGLFAEVGKTSLSGAIGTVMNLNIAPSVVSFTNTNVVGTLAGKLDGGTVINVNVLQNSGSNVIVVGNNIVGGIVGLAIGNYKLQNLYSQVSAKARNIRSITSFRLTSTNYEGYSYAGTSVGILSGRGKVFNCLSDGDVSVLGFKAGILFGLVDEDVSVEKLFVKVTEDISVNAYAGYGGLVVGESKGYVKNVRVEKMTSNTEFKNFKKLPSIPLAIGGFAGLINGGTIDDVTVLQGINVGDINADTGIDSVGGLAGEISKTTQISNVTVEGNYTGFSNVGGVVGKVSNVSGVIEFKDVEFNGTLSVYGQSMNQIAIGGLVGYIEENGAISLDINGYDFNKFNTEIKADACIYGSKTFVGNYSVGGVIGLSETTKNLYIKNVKAYLNCDFVLKNISGYGTDNEGILKVESQQQGSETVYYVVKNNSDGNNVAIDEKNITATNSYFDYNVEFTGIKTVADSNYHLIVVTCGSPKVELFN